MPESSKRKSIDCRNYPSEKNCSLKISGTEDEVLDAAVQHAVVPPKLWINAASATIYRHAFDRPMDEVDGEIGGNEPGLPSTWRFSYDVAKSWERAFFQSAFGMRSATSLAMRVECGDPKQPSSLGRRHGCSVGSRAWPCCPADGTRCNRPC